MGLRKIGLTIVRDVEAEIAENACKRQSCRMGLAIEAAHESELERVVEFLGQLEIDCLRVGDGAAATHAATVRDRLLRGEHRR